jgi:thiol-disulfide isomerase/thioredoxin
MIDNLKILYFTAPWCGQCKLQWPVMSELNKTYKVDTMSCEKEESLKLADSYWIQTIPAIVIITTHKQPDWQPDAEVIKIFKWMTSGDTLTNYIENW